MKKDNSLKRISNLAFRNGFYTLKNALLKQTLGAKKIGFDEIDKIANKILKKEAK